MLGEIIAEGEGVFTEDQLNIAENPALKNIIRIDPTVNYIAGVDYGKLHDNSVITVIHQDRKSGKAILDYQRVILSKYQGKEYEDIRNDLIEVILAFRPSMIVCDSSGIGDPILEQMDKDLIKAGWFGKIYSNKKNRKGFVFDVRSKPDLIENLQNFFSRGRIMVPHRDEPTMDMLRNELLNFSYEMTNTNYIITFEILLYILKTNIKVII